VGAGRAPPRGGLPGAAAGFFLLAVLAVLWLEWAPLTFAIAQAVPFFLVGFYLRRMNRPQRG
jgi:hypothetical protein